MTVGAPRAAVLAGLGYLTAAGAPFAAGTYNAVEYRWDDTIDPTQSTAPNGADYEWELFDGSNGKLTFPNGSNNQGTIQPQVK